MTTYTVLKFGVHIVYVDTIHKFRNRSQGAKTRLRSDILNLRTTVNNSEVAKAIGFIFST